MYTSYYAARIRQIIFIIRKSRNVLFGDIILWHATSAFYNKLLFP